ncbi:MAG: alpha-L-fucosidase [Bacteroidaceae bacterium]|nr:alpha-L-fucosidase [Bacteroidaceae bacterium]
MIRTLCIFVACIYSLSLSAQRVLYIGDSVTDGGWGRSGGSMLPSEKRNHSDLNHVYGHSYMMLCAAHYQSALPYGGLEFLNRGISGNTLTDLEARWEKDVLALKPNILSVLIGTNDVGEWLKEHPSDESFDYKDWESRYRSLLHNMKAQNGSVKLILGTPFVSKTTSAVRQQMTDKLSAIVRRIAKDERAVCVPFDSLFNQLQRRQPNNRYWIWDGIHPTAAGHQQMADLWISKAAEAGLLLTGGDNRVTIPVSRQQLEQSPEGPFEATWKSLEQNYRTPEWFMDAKFGIFIHWGVYSVPAAGSEWYPKHMYNAMSVDHQKQWGKQSQFGYKDFIPMFKAEKFNAKAWAELFRKAGARYVIPTAEHHDGFAMYDSKLTRWNAKQMGPCRDIIGELAEAVRHEGLKFGVSNHRIENWDFMYPLNMPKDSTDLFLPEYSDLYGPPQKPTEQSGMGPKALAAAANGGATEAVINEAAQEGRHPQSDAFLNEWELRVHEIIDRYQPDLLYFDNGINYRSLDPWKLRLARYYYNSAYQWHKEVSIQSKSQAYLAGSIIDFERESRAPRKPYGRYWQVDDPLGNKFGYIEGLKLQNADGIIRNLVDNVACGGNLCLNVSPKSDGTIPDDQQQVLLKIGEWLQTYGEGIYGTRPYKTAIERNIRLTCKDGFIYAFVLRWDGKPFTIHCLDSSKVKDVICMEDGRKIRFKKQAVGLQIEATGIAINSAIGFRVVLKRKHQ